MKEKLITEPVIIDRSLLNQQVGMISNIASVSNSKTEKSLTGVNQLLEVFARHPKGEYQITIKIV